MQDKILTPKFRKGKKPVKVRKPSKPIDGINHRLLREQIRMGLAGVEQHLLLDGLSLQRITRLQSSDLARQTCIKFFRKDRGFFDLAHRIP